MEQKTIAIATKKAQLPTFIELVKNTLETYKEKWKILLKIIFSNYVFVIATFAASLIVATAGVIAARQTNNIALPVIAGSLATMIGIAFIFVAVAWLNAARIIVLKNRKDDFGLRRSLKQARPYVMPYLWVAIVSLPILVLGYIFFIIPGIILSVWFLFYSYIVIIENEKGINALIKSREYVRGYFLNIFLLSALGLVSMLFIESALQSLTRPLGSPIGNIISIAAGFFLSPILPIYNYLIFENLKKIKGDSVPAPTAGQRNFFLALAVCGLIVIAAIIGLLIHFAPEIKIFFDEQMRNQPAAMQNNLPVMPQNTL